MMIMMMRLLLLLLFICEKHVCDYTFVLCAVSNFRFTKAGSMQPDPVISRLRPDRHFGSISEHMQKLIDNYMTENPDKVITDVFCANCCPVCSILFSVLLFGFIFCSLVALVWQYVSQEISWEDYSHGIFVSKGFPYNDQIEFCIVPVLFIFVSVCQAVVC